LVERCKQGDISAYTAMYHKHAKELYNTIHRIIRHTAESEDILQETFVTAFQHIGSFQQKSSFRTWIKRIAINKSITELRKKKMRFVSFDSEEIRESEDQPVDEKAFSLNVAEIRNAIEQLPDHYRTVVNLFLVENLPHEEISEMLGIPCTTVRSQYHRAKQKILLSIKKTDVS
jgi:RNA polymerase sigma factor (sigma-70 family)